MLSDAQATAVITGNQAIVVYGEIRYRDAFDRDRFVRYRRFTGGPIGISRMRKKSVLTSSL